MLIKLDDLRTTKDQAKELFSFLAPVISGYSHSRSGTPWDRSHGGSCYVLDDYDERMRIALEGRRDVMLRAYHCTRVSSVEALGRDGLLQLNVPKARSELLKFAETILGKSIPNRVVEKWLELTEDDRSYVKLRELSPGPAFTLGLKSVFNSAVRRYFYEGGETIYHIAPVLVSCLKEDEPSFPYEDGETFWNDFRKCLQPALLICDLSYWELGQKQQQEIRRLLIQAWLYEESEEYPWDGGVEFHAGRNIPSEWIRRGCN